MQVNVQDRVQEFLKAVACGDLAVLRLLLRTGMLRQLHLEESAKPTNLHQLQGCIKVIINSQNKDMYKLLLDFSYLDPHDLLAWAIVCDSAALVEMLFKKNSVDLWEHPFLCGVNVTAILKGDQKSTLISATPQSFGTPLKWAVEIGNVDIVTQLLEKGFIISSEPINLLLHLVSDRKNWNEKVAFALLIHGMEVEESVKKKAKQHNDIATKLEELISLTKKNKTVIGSHKGMVSLFSEPKTATIGGTRTLRLGKEAANDNTDTKKSVHSILPTHDISQLYIYIAKSLLEVAKLRNTFRMSELMTEPPFLEIIASMIKSQMKPNVFEAIPNLPSILVPFLHDNEEILRIKAHKILTSEVDAEYVELLNFLEENLAQIVGLHSIKAELRGMLKSLLLDKRRKQQGIEVASKPTYHMAFKGNPGVGKTSIARLLGKLLQQLNILSKGHVVEVQRGDLVGAYVGHTAKQTRSKMDEAKGGILFVDEAYRLSNPGMVILDAVLMRVEGADFGQEAIDEIMSVMLDAKDLVVIFAGYPKEMEKFINSNPGLPRRIRYHFNFEDYSPKELAQILIMIVEQQKFRLDPELTEPKLLEFIENETTIEQRSQGNAGLIKNIVMEAIQNLNNRLPITASGSQLITLQTEDIVYAFKLHR